MTDKQFYTLWAEALTSADRDAFVSDWALSSIWEDAEGDGITTSRIADLEELWDVAHATVRDIREHTGLTQAAFAVKYCIPKRSVENWESGSRSCPDYVRLLLAQVTGFYKR